MKALIKPILLCLCLLLAACSPASKAMYAATDAGTPDIEKDTSAADIAETDTEQTDANEADAVEEIGEPVSCEPFEGLIQENMIDCGVITRSSFGPDECNFTQISCTINSLTTCTPFFLLLHNTNMIDSGDFYSLIYSTGASQNNNPCEYSIIVDALTAEYDDPEANRVIKYDNCTRDGISTYREMCLADFDSGCDPRRDLGTCADVYASCPLCTEGRQ